MTRDHLLGFPPVLLAQDDQMPCSDEGLHFPLGIPESAYTDYKSRPEHKRTRELMAFEMTCTPWTSDGRHVNELDCRQVKPSVHTYSGIAGTTWTASGETLSPSSYSIIYYNSESWRSGAEFIQFEPNAEPLLEAPTTPAGVWRKTAEHKPPVGAHGVRHADGTLCFDRMFDGIRWLPSVDPDSPPSCMQTWQWLDTSGEFKVGDRVRVKDGVVSEFCKPGMTGAITRNGPVDAWFREDASGREFCAGDWLEHA